jgi:cysteinyl-tRNA synthetase
MKIYNSFSREKENFEPISPPFVGLYVCGPTVYSDVHLGNCRTFVSFDVVYRYLTHKGFKVRYVRNVTDVGHLEGDQDSGAEDKISKKARLERIEPMEIVQRYTVGFRDVMNLFNNLPPCIEPSATGHLMEQIEMVERILENGYAYEVNGSVYFDTPKLVREKGVYGRLSGKQMDDLLAESRELKNQGEKRHPSDFAIWIKADESHLMRWKAPWSVGFPGWHLECSAMSTKYLGPEFDIHGGGMDLQFPHHENEIAQNFGACGCAPVRFWMHGNMLLLNGKKMSKTPDPVTGKSNSILPLQLFSGDNNLFAKAYSPMTLRFFMLQTHYRSTLDLTDPALQAAEKGYARLMEAHRWLQGQNYAGPEAPTAEDAEVNALLDSAFAAMDDDFSTPQALAALFELVPKINSWRHGKIPMGSVVKATFERLKVTFRIFLHDIFGLLDETRTGTDAGLADGLMQLILELRKNARDQKDWGTSDRIRDRLQALDVQVKDGKEGASWSKI